jgi:hypothetical protein
MALRPRRLVAGVLAAAGLTAAAGAAFASVTIANELALRERPAAVASRFGPTDLDRAPVACDAPLVPARSARLTARYEAAIDLRPVGSVELVGLRSGQDLRWLAYVATDRELGQYGMARRGERTWTRTPQAGWQATPPGTTMYDQTVDLRAMATALQRGSRATAEDYGIEVIEGAPARRCRVAVDGATFQAAFPAVRWLVGEADLSRWRGQVDYWIFLDDEIGQIAGSANGEAVILRPEALQGRIDVHLTATERDRDLVVYPPAP